MFRRCFYLILIPLLLFGCNDTKTANMSYDEMKKMMVDTLQTEDGKKALIIASGYNVYPRDVEEVLYEHEAVQEAVVIGVPDEYRGELI